jgi:hypothetical protein
MTGHLITEAGEARHKLNTVVKGARTLRDCVEVAHGELDSLRSKG